MVCGTLRPMGMLRRAFESHHLAAHTTWAAVWTGVFFLLAVVLEGDQPRPWWVLAVAVMLGIYHLLFRVGRWADRIGQSNSMARRATRLAWIFPVAFPVFVVWEAVTG